MPAAPNALDAAHRARTIAGIARTRADNPTPIPDATGRAALRKIATCLDVAAHSLETEEPPTWHDTTITNTLDADTFVALSEADQIAADNPTIGFPPHLSQYVTAPVYGTEIDMPPSLEPASIRLAQEGGMFAQVLMSHTYLSLTNDPTTMSQALKIAFEYLWQHAQLTASATDNTPPHAPATPHTAEQHAPQPAPGTEHPFSVSDIAHATAKRLGTGWRAQPGPHGTTGTIQGPDGKSYLLAVGDIGNMTPQMYVQHDDDQSPMWDTEGESLATLAHRVADIVWIYACD
ncbi:hypothetical protein [Streptomyces sp. NPDC047315]|uniref:hypothetical protein n=1 Tax=Streptomyces sp. NPDC047315 TaxID=3155142 RepID=UPI0033E76933